MAELVTLTATGLTVASKAQPALWDLLKKRMVSLNDEKEVSDALGQAIEKLVCQKIDYENNVNSHCLKVPSETYLHWLEVVEEIEKKANELLMRCGKKSKMAFIKRPALMEEIRKLDEKVEKLKVEGDQLESKLFVDPKLEPVIRNNETPDIKKFGSLQEPLEQILVLLQNDKVYKLGIYGPLGIGKTTIMWNLNNHEEVARSFDIVIWVKASMEGNKENISMERIQQVICRRLKLDLEGNTDHEEVKRVISRVMSYKKYLLLLDDVKEPPDLEKIGIPANKNGSKVVLTTRLHHVCSLTVDRMIRVSYLSPDESWKMFQDVMKQPKLIKDSKIGPLAWRVCKECSGLPLLVEKVASTFRLKNNEHDWVEGLNSWRMWPETERQGIEEMHNMFKFCYDDLDNDDQKKCFLYGALYPEDCDIYSDCLLECWAAEDLISKDGDKIMFAHLVLNRLKNVSLLMEGKTENHITMHKFIRQVALHILESDSEFQHLVKTNGGLREPPDAELWLEKNRISLGENKLYTLPDSPDCKELYTLFLQKNLNLEKIPMSFFKYMESLQVLDLSHTGILSLPSSLLILIRLKILYLNNCKHLKNLPTDIRKLERLEALDIRGSGIVNIPSYIGNLINLQRLRLSFSVSGSAENKDATQEKQPQRSIFNIPTYIRNVINSGRANATQEEKFIYSTISKLSQLEELVIDVETPDMWSNEVVGNIIDAVAPLKNFKTLKFFFSDKVVDSIDVAPTTLRIRVPESSILLSFIKRCRWGDVRSINSFQFYISSQSLEHPELINFVKYDKYVKYCNGDGSNFPTEVLSVADAFELVNHKGIKQLSDIEIGSMNNLQACLVESCDAFETVVNATNEAVLPNLEHLYLKNLPKLRSICEGTLQHGSLTKIKTLAFVGCHLLTDIFPDRVIQQLCGIEHLVVEDCPEIEELFSFVRRSDVLPKLKKLKLIGIQKLTKICDVNALNWPSLEKVKISECPQLKQLPFNEVNATKLKVIKADQHWWKNKEQLQNFCLLGK